MNAACDDTEWFCVARPNALVRHVALGPEHVAFTTDEGVFRASFSGGAVERIGDVRARALAAHGDVVAWAEATTNQLVIWSARGQRVLPVDGHPWWVAVDDAYVTWLSPSFIEGSPYNDYGLIQRAPIRGGLVETLAERVYMPDYGVLADASLWFASHRAIHRLAIATREIEVVHEHTEGLAGLACVRDMLVWPDGGRHERLWWALRPREGLRVAPAVDPLALCREAVIELVAAPNGVVWIESPGYDEPCTLHGCPIDTRAPFAFLTPEGVSVMSVACDAERIVIGLDGMVLVARLPEALGRHPM